MAPFSSRFLFKTLTLLPATHTPVFYSSVTPDSWVVMINRNNNFLYSPCTPTWGTINKKVLLTCQARPNFNSNYKLKAVFAAAHRAGMVVKPWYPCIYVSLLSPWFGDPVTFIDFWQNSTQFADYGSTTIHGLWVPAHFKVSVLIELEV